jgi:hypothetical protein
MENVTEGNTAAANKIIQLTKDGKTAKIKGIASGARTIKLTAKAHNGKKDVLIVEVKPYTDYSTERIGGDLTCKYFGTATTKVFNHDLYYDYVQPKMQTRVVDGTTNYYGTRASVVAAARFLVLQFPYTIPYYMEKRGIKNHPTKSHYVWVSGTKQEKAADARIYGFNLTQYAYNSATSSKAVLSDVTPWACEMTVNGETKKNGLECSGFVTWAMRNGRFNLGDWKTHMFGSNGNCYLNGKKVKNYLCTSFVNNTEGNGRSNANNSFDSTFTKLSALKSHGNTDGKESDFLTIGKITTASQKKIKAGDLLWHGNYEKADGSTGSGHIAMIIGITRNEDKTIKKIYVGEATTSNGNKLSTYSWEAFQKCSPWAKNTCKITNGEYAKDSSGNFITTGTRLYTSYVIRMDNVYNYFSNKYSFDKNGSDYKYTDHWNDEK